MYRSETWKSISSEEKQKLGVHALHDGEFWISFDDFFSNFHQLHICHRGPASLGTTEEDAGVCTWSNLFRDDKLTWKEELFHGEWVPGSTAGGAGQPNKGLTTKIFTPKISMIFSRKILDQSSVFSSFEFYR